MVHNKTWPHEVTHNVSSKAFQLWQAEMHRAADMIDPFEPRSDGDLSNAQATSNVEQSTRILSGMEDGNRGQSGGRCIGLKATCDAHVHGTARKLQDDLAQVREEPRHGEWLGASAWSTTPRST